jgi:hypothetical protein
MQTDWHMDKIFSSRLTGHFLSSGTYALERFTPWGELGRGDSPNLPQTSQTALEAHSFCVCPNFLAPQAPHRIRDIESYRDRFAPHVFVVGPRGHLECIRKTVPSGKRSHQMVGRSARADWSLSPSMLSKESVLTSPCEELRNECLSTWIRYDPRKSAFNSCSLFIVMDFYR